MAGLTQSAISQIERKESKPQKKTREKLAKIYNCLPEQLSI
ncbi:helix-turn-helix transcriptional regulator [Haemophilus parahaemolyticus]|nr:helix-turn-helix transcriptional regulator [Haemophilus parahaemolyticus]